MQVWPGVESGCQGALIASLRNNFIGHHLFVGAFDLTGFGHTGRQLRHTTFAGHLPPMAIEPPAPRGADLPARTPSPVRGLVVRHAFLWSNEKAAGRDEGSKDRPAVIVLITAPDEARGIRIGVVPVTHTPPADPDGGLEMPESVKRQLGLEMDPQWIVLDEINRFVWPGYDLRKVPRPGTDTYGMLPEAVYQEVIKRLLARNRALKTIIVDRD
jgi:hypothetical protein